MNRKNTSWLSVLTCTAAILFWVGCSDPQDTGVDVLPPTDLVNLAQSDTFSIELTSQVVDSVQTFALSRHLIGNYFDPQFGRVSTATYCQPTMSGSSLYFGEADDLIFDSLVLTLDVSGVYGRYDSPQKIRIHELGESLNDLADTISSRASFATTGNELSNGYSIDFRDLPGYTDLAIRLSDELGERLLFADTANYETNSVFTEFFKGLRIETEDVEYLSREPGAIYYLNLESSVSKLSLYYQVRDSAGDFVSTVYRFSLNSLNRFHSITRDQEESVLLGSTIADQYEFVQAGSLVKLFARFPHIDSLDVTGINQAKFILNVDPDFLGSNTGVSNRFLPPSTLVVYTADSTGTVELLLNGAATSAGQYNSSSNQYEIDLTAYVQRILRGQDNNGLLIWPDNAGVSLNRAVFGGEGHPTLQPKLILTYTEFPK